MVLLEEEEKKYTVNKDTHTQKKIQTLALVALFG